MLLFSKVAKLEHQEPRMCKRAFISPNRNQLKRPSALIITYKEKKKKVFSGFPFNLNNGLKEAVI